MLRRSEFVRAQRCAASVRGRSLTVLVYLRGDVEPARLGVVASRKVGNAVARNRGKRRIREWFRRLGQRAPDGADVLVVLRQGAPDRPAAELWTELDGALERAVEKARAKR